MSKFETYYKEIRQHRAELSRKFPDNACLVVAAGCVTEVTLDIAARLLTENTHFLASDEQARVFREAQALTRARTTSDPITSARLQFGLLVGKGEQRQ